MFVLLLVLLGFGSSDLTMFMAPLEGLPNLWKVMRLGVVLSKLCCVDDLGEMVSEGVETIGVNAVGTGLQSYLEHQVVHRVQLFQCFRNGR